MFEATPTAELGGLWDAFVDSKGLLVGDVAA